MPELSFHSVKELEDAAVELVKSPRRLAVLRKRCVSSPKRTKSSAHDGRTQPKIYVIVVSGSDATYEMRPVSIYEPVSCSLSHRKSVTLLLCWALCYRYLRLLSASMNSPLFDTPLITRNLERAYQAMWEVRAMGLSPKHIGACDTKAFRYRSAHLVVHDLHVDTAGSSGKYKFSFNAEPKRR